MKYFLEKINYIKAYLLLMNLIAHIHYLLEMVNHLINLIGKKLKKLGYIKN
jgi:hypothetical protein